MMQKKTFKPEELGICDYQYQIRHTDINAFKVGEKVFLKSNPEWPMEVFGVSKMFNHVLVKTMENKIESFPPEVLLQYKYRALQVYKRKYLICMN